MADSPVAWKPFRSMVGSVVLAVHRSRLGRVGAIWVGCEDGITSSGKQVGLNHGAIIAANGHLAVRYRVHLALGSLIKETFGKLSDCPM